MEPLLLRKEWIVVTCKNCGHKCHCDEICKQEMHDGDMQPITIECCKNCRHKNED